MRTGRRGRQAGLPSQHRDRQRPSIEKGRENPGPPGLGDQRRHCGKISVATWPDVTLIGLCGHGQQYAPGIVPCRWNGSRGTRGTVQAKRTRILSPARHKASGPSAGRSPLAAGLSSLSAVLVALLSHARSSGQRFVDSFTAGLHDALVVALAAARFVVSKPST